MLMMKLSGCLQAEKTEDKGKRICEVELVSNQYFKSSICCKSDFTHAAAEQKFHSHDICGYK